jgi:hypothetical protein
VSKENFEYAVQLGARLILKAIRGELFESGRHYNPAKGDEWAKAKSDLAEFFPEPVIEMIRRRLMREFGDQPSLLRTPLP